MINTERLTETFTSLVRIDSPSREEQEVASVLKDRLTALGASVRFDNAGEAVEGTVGNLIATFPGNCAVPSMLLSSHMDTVEPGRGIVPVLEDGVFRSQGDTILGGDDKSGIAAILEVLTLLTENNLPHGPIEVVFTICEEVGLLGAKHLDVSALSSRFGYVLDSGDVNGIVTRAPSANHFKFEVYGKEAHAGSEPERGINAIKIAGTAIANAPTGRMDAETTCNFGKMEGGTATNIVPGKVTVLAEARSHNPETLAVLTKEMVEAFEKAVADAKETPDAALPGLHVEVEQDFPHTRIPEDAPVICLAKAAGKTLGREIVSKTIGGGADANVLFAKGIQAGVIGTGMTDVHTVEESLKLSDMAACAELLLAIIDLHAAGNH